MEGFAGIEGPGAPPATRRILKGELAYEVARFGAPLALGMGLQTTFNLVDAYIISRLSPEVASPALGAIGICDPLAAVGTIVSYGVSVATGAMLSRKQGEGDVRAVHRIAWQSTLLVAALSVCFGLFGVLGGRWVLTEVIGAKGDVATLGVDYLRIMVGGSFSMFLLLHLTTIQRSLGSSKTPVTLLVVANLLNLVLAILLVYGSGPGPEVFTWSLEIAEALHIPRLELRGAAWATVLARLIVLLPTAWVVAARFGILGRDARGPLELGIIRSIWRIAWPTSIQLVVRILAMLLTHTLVARAYTTETDQSATTALGIVFRPETMALFVGLGWGSAAQTFVGQNLGATQPRRAQMSGWYAGLYQALMMIVFSTVYLTYAHEFVRFFDAEPKVIRIGVDYIAWVAPSYVGLGLAVVLGSAIQGAGATRQTLVLDLIVIVLVQAPICIAVAALGLPPVRLWQTLAAVYVVHAAVYALSYRRGAYLHTSL